MKEAVEEAFTAGLLKVVFATETLSLGINMPARSVVVEKLSKFTGEHHELLTPGEYTQLAGRAGRRGIDDVGYAVVLWDPFVGFDQVAGLASRRTYALTSSFRATYNMAANLVQRYPRREARRLLDLSFAQYHADRDAVALTRQLEKTREQLARARDAARVPNGDIEEYRALLASRDEARRAAHAVQDSRLDKLRPGDVVMAPSARRPGGRAEAGARALGQPRARPDPAAHDGAPDPRRLSRARSAASRPSSSRARSHPGARRSSGRRSRCSGACPIATIRAPTTPTHASATSKPACAPTRCTAFAGTEVALRGAWQADRIARDVARLERRIAGKTETLAGQFDRVLAVLESWGYVRGWELLPSGRLLARLNTECDLVVAEALRTGLLDGLDAAEITTVVSCFVYQRRGARRRRPDAAAPVADAARQAARPRHRAHRA